MSSESIETRVVWQPKALYQSTGDFAILLDRRFAEEMLNVKLTREQQARMDYLAKRLGVIERFKIKSATHLFFMGTQDLLHN